MRPGRRRDDWSLKRCALSLCRALSMGWTFLGTRSDEFESMYMIGSREQRHTCCHLLPPKPHPLAKSLTSGSEFPCLWGQSVSWEKLGGLEVESSQAVLCSGRVKLSLPAPLHTCVLYQGMKSPKYKSHTASTIILTGQLLFSEGRERWYHP